MTDNSLGNIVAHMPIDNLVSMQLALAAGTVHMQITRDGVLAISQQGAGGEVALQSYGEFQQFESALFQMGIALEASERAEADLAEAAQRLAAKREASCADPECACNE